MEHGPSGELWKELQDLVPNIRRFDWLWKGGRCAGKPGICLPDPTFHGRVKLGPETTQKALSLWIVKDIGNRCRGLVKLRLLPSVDSLVV